MQPVDRLDGGRGIEERGIGQRPLGHVDQHSHAVRDILVEGSFEAEEHRVGCLVGIDATRVALDAEQRSTGRDERAERRHHHEGAVGRFGHGDEIVVAYCRHHARNRSHDDVRRGDIHADAVRINAIEQLSSVVADELDESRDPQRSADVMDVQHEHDDAHDHQQVRHDDGEPGHCPAVFEPNFSQGQHRMHERGDEQADCDLAGFVAQDPLHDAGRELAHGELYDHHRDREDERSQRDHRGGDRGQDRHRGIRSTGERLGDELEVVGLVDPDRPERQDRAQQDADDRYEPQARPDVAEEPVHSHYRALP